MFLVVTSLAERASAVRDRYEPAIDPQPGFCLPNWEAEDVDPPDWQTAIQQMSNMGVPRLSLITYRFYDPATGNISSTSNYGLKAPPTNAQLASVIDDAVAHGMHVSLNPFVEIDNSSGIGHTWRGDLNTAAYPLTDPELADFFSQYEDYIGEMAELAQGHGASHLLVGSELKGLTLDPRSQPYWGSVITRADGAFGGTLGYAANWGEYPDVPFWAQLDRIGVDAYFPLASQDEARAIGDPLPDVIEANWQSILDQLESFGQSEGKLVVIEEWGAVPHNGTTVWPWRSDPKLAPDPSEPPPSLPIPDPDEQLHAYMGTVRATESELDWLEAINFWHFSMPGNSQSPYQITPDSEVGQYISSYVPEPSTLALGATALLFALCFGGRRARRGSTR
jgi:hypothetical protein